MPASPICLGESFIVALGPTHLSCSSPPVLGLMGAVPYLGLSWPEIVQGLQLPSEHTLRWTQRGLRVQERGNSPQDRILLSWEAEAEGQLHRELFGLPSCSLLWQAVQPSRSHFLHSTGTSICGPAEEADQGSSGAGTFWGGYAGECDSWTFQTHVNPKYEL